MRLAKLTGVWKTPVPVPAVWLFTPLQTPATHLSPVVLDLPSLQGVLSGSVVVKQPPVVGSQAAAWQAPGSGQTSGGPATQPLSVQWSPCVQGLPSSHEVLTVLAPAQSRSTPSQRGRLLPCCGVLMPDCSASRSPWSSAVPKSATWSSWPVKKPPCADQPATNDCWSMPAAEKF